MRKLKLFAALLAASVLVLAGCSNPLLGGTVIGTDNAKKTVKISIDNYNEFFQSDTNGSRTIMGDPTVADNNTFYLWGDATNGEILAPVKITSLSGSKGTIDLAIGPYCWDLTLAVCESAPADESSTSSILAKATLIGYATVDMEYTSDVSFTLTPKGLTNPAEVELTLKPINISPIPDWIPLTDYTIKAGIYNLATGAELDSAYTQSITETDWVVGSTVKYTANAKNDIPPGTYEFAIVFENPKGKTFTYSDTFIILPGRKNEATVEIPNVIGALPEAPASAKAGYIDGSEDTSNGLYIAEFEWTDSSNNEENFVLQITDDPANVDWDDPDTYKEYCSISDLAADDIYVGKTTLRRNSTSVQIYLKLGKEYAAQICAENAQGRSTFTPVDVNTNDTTNGKKFAPSDTINRYRVTYHLNGGAYSSDGTLLKETTADIIEYHCKDATTGVSIINPQGEKNPTPPATASEYLVHESLKFAKWTYGDQTIYPTDDSPYVPDAYKDSANLDLYATYAGTAEWEIYNDLDYDIVKEWISLSGGALTFSTDASGKVTGIATISKAAADSTGTIWSFTSAAKASGSPVDASFVYDAVTFEFTKGGYTYFANTVYDVAIGAKKDFSVGINKLRTGIYFAKFTARYNQTVVSFPVVVNVTD